MSLIQEALKRQQEEGAQAAVPPKPPIPGLAMKPKPTPMAPPSPAQAAPEAAPTHPPPLPLQPPAPPPPETTPEAQDSEAPPPETEPELPPAERKAFSTLAIIVAVILVLLMAGISMVYFAFARMRQSAAEKAVALLKPAVTQMVAVAAQAVPQTNTSAPPAPDATSGQTAPTQQVTAAAATHAPPATNAPPVIALPPPPPKPAIEWPVLKLTAIAGKGLKGAARINGEVVMVGESVEGAKLLEINDQNVVLEFNGEKDTLRIGTSTR